MDESHHFGTVSVVRGLSLDLISDTLDVCIIVSALVFYRNQFKDVPRCEEAAKKNITGPSGNEDRFVAASN